MLTTHEKLKYSRQILVDSFGEGGQIKLQNATVLIVGMGGLGNPAAQYLAASGVGKLILADGDKIEITNLPRQILFGEDDIDENKADIAEQKLAAQYPELEIEVFDEMLDEEMAEVYCHQADVVLDCTDNLTARYLINQACINTKTPLVVGAATGLDGQCLVVDSNQEDSACYQCLFPSTQQAPAQNCQTIGILGPVLAMIAGMQALNAIKIITGKTPQVNKLMMLDGASNQWREFGLTKQNNCVACS